MKLISHLACSLSGRFRRLGAHQKIDLEVIPQQHTEVPADRRRTIIYAILRNTQVVGAARVEYFHDRQHALIHNLDIEQDFRRQGIGHFTVGWLISRTPYLVGTSYERESAYDFWGEMRNEFKGRMLPPPA